MSDTIHPANVTLRSSESPRTSPEAQGVDVETYDLDLLLSSQALNWQHFQGTDLQTPSPFWLDAIGTDESVAAPNSGNMGLPANSSAPWDWPPLPNNASSSSLDPTIHISLQLLTAQVQSLTARVTVLEGTYQKVNNDIEDFITWSKRMEECTHGINDALSELIEMVRKPEFIRSVLEDSLGTPSTQAAKK
ncbi:hypothetical protein DL764_005706 [Monosporascus ibericus]|uniref:Uncharacterized protein n=1 Tax=Monosporascus ibericus TaxID=155417 RepID=A0A4Q4TAQ8_9PEZI|nr:hypothetical protein DL764_005706 [Monosporascus ibericus]